MTTKSSLRLRSAVKALVRSIGLFALVLLSACAEPPPAPSAQDHARAALAQLDGGSLRGGVLERAVQELSVAQRIDANDPWVALASSELRLALGYRSGDAFRGRSYAPEAIAQADRLLQPALQADPPIARAYLTLARLQILRGQRRQAWETLNTAYRLQPEHHRPWLLRGVIALQMKDPQRAKIQLDEAERWADSDAAMIAVLRQRARMERVHGTPESELVQLRRIIEIDPDAAHAHGNLGAALLRMQRYEEAIDALERGLSIERYPLAESQLARAREALASR
ncbi:tetratricopeptide repeat protein [Aquimonas voraii]|uniref:Tetratricopeptide repeat-containing protein n=1 Tax=Aquimonas voraii TaxID=265719 RepID=A0A1G6VXK6_9GAMM|nr:tetratricopeptide repeat protein [Aquimonas voraii]SDD58298.1 Tetratricopeptide repeat-containing protein [Aquimonas voraii]